MHYDNKSFQSDCIAWGDDSGQKMVFLPLPEKNDIQGGNWRKVALHIIVWQGNSLSYVSAGIA